MKLYTEEQVLQIIANLNREHFVTAEELLEEMGHEPIELPSDDEISHLHWLYCRMSNVHGENENYDYMLKFKEIIEQLKRGGNNDQQ
jgi:hypothetical protein